MDSSFVFLKSIYPELYTLCELSEKLIDIDASSSLAKSRLVGEKTLELIWKFEELESIQEAFANKINLLYRGNHIPEIVRDLFDTIRRSGNRAAHQGKGSREEAVFILKKTFRLTKWFYETYENINLGEISYHLPEKTDQIDFQIDVLNQQLVMLKEQLVDYKEKIEKLNLSQEIIYERKKRSEQLANNIELDEYDTRVMLIDPMLRKAGWECDTDKLNFKTNKTLPQKGRNIAIAEWRCGTKWADYALFIGTTLYALVEAKKFATDISTNLEQSKIYANNILQENDLTFLGEWNGYKVPFLFSTNGREYLEQIKTKSGVWFLDVRDSYNRPKALPAWYSPKGLEELYKRDLVNINNDLKNKKFDYLEDKNGLGLRYYQIDAIKAVENKIINNIEDRRALLVMATGTGKTRTAIGLAYRLVQVNRFRRILFLTDRRLLATQAYDSFQESKVENIYSFADSYDIKGLKDVLPDAETRLHFATVQSMIKRLFYSVDEEKILPIDTYDCIIVDEAHRGYNLDRELDEDDLFFRDQNDYVSQYKRVIEYFDAHVIGLTATPALHTTQIFGTPVHTYSYREAVIDGYLVDHEPPYIIKTKLGEDGISWAKGEKPKAYDPENTKIVELAELEDELHFDIETFNKQVITEGFNRVVAQQLVKELDPEGDEKTLIFAARDSHADMIIEMLFEEYATIGVDIPQDAIKKITGKAYKPEDLTKYFKNEKYPNIVVTVDLLTTGVDVPEITNLVFLRRVNSRILFEQMLGRATRLCPDIGKEYFRIYDAVNIYEALSGFTQMQTVSNPSYSFSQLVEELNYIEKAERKEKQIEQIVAKLQRKTKKLEGNSYDQFVRLNGGMTPNEFINQLKNGDAENVTKQIQQLDELWSFLDKKIYKPQVQLYSDHEDELIEIERGYGKGKKPEDYISSFKEFIQNNRNKIMALNTICTKPNELSRDSLKELKLILDQEGFNELSLNTAWRSTKNEDIAADIIAYIRTLALDISLVSPEERVHNAINKVKGMHSWTKIQEKWIERFEKQLLAESILTKEDLDKDPFKSEGGYNRLNKIFNNELDKVLETINDSLYRA